MKKETFNDLRKRIARAIAEASFDNQRPQWLADAQRVLDMIDAMTPEERLNSDLLLDRSTRERIARDANVSLEEVGELIAQQQGMAKMPL